MKKIMLLLSLSAAPVHAGLYSEYEIEHFLSQQAGKSGSLTQQVLTSPTPDKTVKAWLISEKNELNKEQQLYNLLNHLATMPSTDALIPVLKRLSNYQAKAVRIHPEARHPNQASEAIFNIASKAAGIQNIWLMKDVQQKTTQILTSSKDMVSELENLISHSKSQNAALLGIKNAIKNVSEPTLEQFKQSLYQSSPTVLIHPVISSIVSVSQDTDFTNWAITQVDKQNAERIYRTVAQHFPAKQCIEILTQNTKSKASPSFVASLLLPHIERELVTSYLIKQLHNNAAAKGAAYALSKSDDPMVWKKMEQVHNSSNSESVKKTIKFSFKHNTYDGAKLIYKRLKTQGEQS